MEIANFLESGRLWQLAVDWLWAWHDPPFWSTNLNSQIEDSWATLLVPSFLGWAQFWPSQLQLQKPARDCLLYYEVSAKIVKQPPAFSFIPITSLIFKFKQNLGLFGLKPWSILVGTLAGPIGMLHLCHIGFIYRNNIIIVKFYIIYLTSKVSLKLSMQRWSLPRGYSERNHEGHGLKTVFAWDYWLLASRHISPLKYMGVFTTFLVSCHRNMLQSSFINSQAYDFLVSFPSLLPQKHAAKQLHQFPSFCHFFLLICLFMSSESCYSKSLRHICSLIFLFEEILMLLCTIQ